MVINQPKLTHGWNLTPKQAIALQSELRPKVETVDRFGKIRRVAGVDVGFEKSGQITRAAVAIYQFPDLSPVETAVAERATSFPYIPGLLSFREIPAVLDALEKLRGPPDLLLCDGQGFAHPRRFGIACHLGILVDLPSIGVGKTRLTGTHEEPPNCKGASVLLTDRGEIIGKVVRTRDSVRPVYVSVGHRVSLNSAVEWVLACTTRFRLPEPIRAAHHAASA